MATVRIKRREGKQVPTYEVRYKDPLTGKWKHYQTFKKLKEAQRASNELRGLIDSGRLGLIEKSKVKLAMLRFSEVAASLVKSWKERSEKGDLSQITFEGYVTRINQLLRVFGNRLLCDITRPEITDYHKKVARELTPITANRNLFVLRQVFNHGLELKATTENPAVGIGFLSEKEQARNKFLKPEQIDKLISASQQTRGKFYLPVLIWLGAEHGASRQEILSLEWADIDFEFEGQGIIRFFRTKNKVERTEFLMPRSRKALLVWRAHLAYMRRKKHITEPLTERVICRINGRPLECFNRSWWATRRLAGLEWFRFHDLRHTFCSNLLLSGAGLKDVKEMIGHKDLSMTDRYSHLTSAHKRRKQQGLAEYYSNGIDLKTKQSAQTLPQEP